MGPRNAIVQTVAKVISKILSKILRNISKYSPNWPTSHCIFCRRTDLLKTSHTFLPSYFERLSLFFTTPATRQSGLASFIRRALEPIFCGSHPAALCKVWLGDQLSIHSYFCYRTGSLCSEIKWTEGKERHACAFLFYFSWVHCCCVPQNVVSLVIHECHILSCTCFRGWWELLGDYGYHLHQDVQIQIKTYRGFRNDPE